MLGRDCPAGRGTGVAPASLEPEAAGHFVLHAQDDLAPSGAQVRFRANLAALRVLRTLQAEERTATGQERAILARWGSWGASEVAEIFDESRIEFEADRVAGIVVATIRATSRNPDVG